VLLVYGNGAEAWRPTQTEESLVALRSAYSACSFCPTHMHNRLCDFAISEPHSDPQRVLSSSHLYLPVFPLVLVFFRLNTLPVCMLLAITTYFCQACASANLLFRPVVRVPDCRLSGPGFEYRRYQISLAESLERGPFSLVRILEELLQRRISGSGLENRDYRPWVSAALTMHHPSIR
jgi:hypothetical protein